MRVRRCRVGDGCEFSPLARAPVDTLLHRGGKVCCTHQHHHHHQGRESLSVNKTTIAMPSLLVNVVAHHPARCVNEGVDRTRGPAGRAARRYKRSVEKKKTCAFLNDCCGLIIMPTCSNKSAVLSVGLAQT